MNMMGSVCTRVVTALDSRYENSRRYVCCQPSCLYDPGIHEVMWDGRNGKGEQVASGIAGSNIPG